jgi:hypothetical protein
MSKNIKEGRSSRNKILTKSIIASILILLLTIKISTGDELKTEQFVDRDINRYTTTIEDATADGYHPKRVSTDLIVDPRSLSFDQVQATDASDIISWEREHDYVTESNSNRQNLPGTVQGNHIDSPEDTIDGSAKILAVGDSYVFGTGVSNLDRTWPRILAAKLRNAAGAGSYTVEALGEGGASFMSYSEWLTKERINTIAPSAIIIGFVPNDAIPGGREVMVCGSIVAYDKPCQVGSAKTLPAYQNCMSGRDGIFGAIVRKIVNPLSSTTAQRVLNRYCALERFNKENTDKDWLTEVNNPEINPYLGMFKRSARNIIKAADNIPVYILLTGDSIESQKSNNYLEILESLGFKIVKTESTQKLFNSGRSAKSLWVNPVDRHPGSELTEAYATDALQALTETIKPSNVVVKSEMKIISNHLPIVLDNKQISKSEVIIRFNKDSSRLRRYGFETELVNRVLPKVLVPCATLGRPHSRIMLNLDRINNPTEAEITLDDTEARGLVISTVGYNSSGVEIIGDAQVITAGMQIKVSVGGEVSGFLVASLKNGCPENKEWNMESYQLRIKIK